MDSYLLYKNVNDLDTNWKYPITSDDKEIIYE